MNFCHVGCPSLAWAVLGLGQGVVIFWFGFWFSRAHSRSFSKEVFKPPRNLCQHLDGGGGEGCRKAGLSLWTRWQSPRAAVRLLHARGAESLGGPGALPRRAAAAPEVTFHVVLVPGCRGLCSSAGARGAWRPDR